jgi:hypothetical protein
MSQQCRRLLTFYSEKARIPAWTDRILRKGSNLRQINYNTAPLRFSDHRPVYATFQCTVSIVDEARRELLSRQIYEKRQLDIGNTSASNQHDDSDDEDLIGYDSIEPGLPPASSDNRKWWLDGGQPARSTIKPPQNGLIPNPNRLSNPYSISDEPDWVTVPRPPPPRGSKNTNSQPPPNPRPAAPGATNGTRKLPPPFAPTVSELTRNVSQASLHDDMATPRPAFPTRPSERRLSTSTTTSSSSKKAPPPVARKPVHLTASPSLTPSPTISNISATSVRNTITAQKPRSSTIDQTGFAPPPRRTTAPRGLGIDAEFIKREIEDKRTSTPPAPPQPRRQGGTKMNTAAEDEGPKPRLPPRRPTMDLLGSDEGSSLSWEALKPS